VSPLPHLAPFLAENSLFKAIGQIFHPLFIAIADVLAFIYGIVPDYAAAIVILTILIMALLTPLTIKSTRSMLAMQALQPEIQKLRQKYKGPENREQLNQEMMRLYREQGVSPTGGCLPMFLQMPALIVLYDILKGLTNTVKQHGHIVAAPRYIPTSSKMYHNLVKSPGVMHSLGLNLALKPFSHHAFWYDYIPYFAFVAAAVALQYVQMSQMTKRNKAAAQANAQMQAMQKIMPLIFAYIYFLIPVGVVLYMIVSTIVRIATQDVIFRTGLVQRPGERQISGAQRPTGGVLSTLFGGRDGRPGAPEDASERTVGVTENAGLTEEPSSGGGAKGKGKQGTSRAAVAGGVTPRSPSPTPAKGAARVREQGRSGTNGAGGRQAAKPHPRSKAKRARKAR
jgi:YidC/Oxa1 family membrane protein insertase